MRKRFRNRMSACIKPEEILAGHTREVRALIEYAETGAQCAYPLPQPTVINGSGSGSLCVDHLLYARVHRENGTTYHLQLLDTGPSGDFHRNCGGFGSGRGIDDWHTLEIVSLPASPVSFNFDVHQELEVELEIKLEEVNARIANGQNHQIKMTGKGDVRWTLPYEKLEEQINHPDL